MKVHVSKATQCAWENREAKYPWRDYLTAEEKATIARADEAKAHWLELNTTRAGIQNRAIQRAKHAQRAAEIKK